jgi:hypothetical protein
MLGIGINLHGWMRKVYVEICGGYANIDEIAGLGA